MVSGLVQGRTARPKCPRRTRRQASRAPSTASWTGLTVSPIRNSRLVDVTFESPDPALSAQVANALAKAYIEQSLEFKFTSSKEASDWLGQRLGEQRKQVEASEQALQQYREQTDSVSLEDKQNIVVQKLADLNAAVTRAKTERIQKEAAVQPDRIAAERSGGARHVPGDPDEHVHPAAEGRAGGPAAAAGAAVAAARTARIPTC